MRKTWRDHFRPIIAKVLEETSGLSEKKIRAALRAACPLGMRKYWPYKVWLSEIRIQRARPARNRVEYVPLFEGLDQ